jgi:subtilisin family serine protease
MFIVAFLLGFQSATAFAAYNGILERADEQFAHRSYTEAGITSALDARHNYQKVIERLIDSLEGQFASARYLQANQFIGDTQAANKESTFMEGFSVGMRSLVWFQREYGRFPFNNKKLDERGRKIYADLIAFHAFNTIGLIRAAGGHTNEWREAERLVGQAIDAGFDHVSDYAPRRALAERAIDQRNFAAAITQLESVLRGTRLSDKASLSKLGIVNYHLAQALKASGQADRAIGMLREYASVDLEKMAWSMSPENQFYQAKSRDLLRSWNADPKPLSIPGEYVVRFKKPIESSAVLGTFIAGNAIRTRQILTPRHALITIPSGSEDESGEILARLYLNDDIEIIEPNYLYYTQKAVNDPLFNQSWALSNTGQEDPRGVKGIRGVDVRALEAWDQPLPARPVVVAVIDTGVDFSHPDLKGTAWVNEAEAKGQPGVDDDGNGYVDDINGYDFIGQKSDPTDDHGHGTHVAGVIAAQRNNGIGTAGVAWNTRIMALRFLGKHGSGSLAGAVQAIDYATRMGARIANNSWGGGPYSQILSDAIKRSGEAGLLFVLAAGNNGENLDQNPTYPVGYKHPNMIAVAAIDNRGRLANFSSYGADIVDIAAPGQNILSTVLDGKYDSWSGTSMSSPFVAAAASLLLMKDPSLTPVQLRERLRDTGTPLVSIRQKVKSGAILNVQNALLGKKSPPDPNDPGAWQALSRKIETPKPYQENMDQVWDIQIPGASMVALRFNQFSLEPGYDRLVFFDGAGHIIGMWTGEPDQQWSPLAEGDTIKIRLITDRSVQAPGFTIDQVNFKGRSNP